MRETETRLHWPSSREMAGELALLAVIALVLAAVGPFGSFALGGFGDRLAYWAPAAFLGYAIFRPVAFVVISAAERIGIGEFPAMLVAVTFAAFPASVAMLWLGGVRFGHALRIADLVQLYFQVALIGAVIATFFALFSRRAEKAAPRPLAVAGSLDRPASEEQRAPFLERLPGHWNGTLKALEMEDHYVRAHGPGGQSVMILMRMADAARELDGAAGARVHRSWWVMREAVTGRRRAGRNTILLLDGGLEAPVARDRAATLRAEGWPV